MFTYIPFVAAALSLLLALASLVRRTPSPATWCFVAGMAALGLDSLCTGLGLRAATVDDAVHWLSRGYAFKALVPAAWIAFSLTYSRGNYREFLVRWRVPLALATLVPVGLALGFRDRLLEVVLAPAPGRAWALHFSPPARALNVTLLVALVFALMNLEQTFRSAVGTMRWRIKFVVLALGVILGTRLYVRSQAILFSTPDIGLWGVESAALLVGCLFMMVAYARTGLAEIDVYPSAAVLRSSLTVVIVGVYLFVVGVLAQVARRFGGVEAFQVQAFVVLLGMAGLAVLLLSDRLRHGIHRFVVRHFRKAQHDSVRIWRLISHRLARVADEAALGAVATRLVSETFEVLAVTAWLHDEEKGQLVAGASTARRPDEAADGERPEASSAVAAGLQERTLPFDLDAEPDAWAEEFRRLNPSEFPNGGRRWCVPLRAGEKSLGALVLADRVNGAAYTEEELELLKCIGDQVTSVLLNLRLAHEVARARELEAFRTMSAFFVHDLKNAAASLNLMLRNLPVHFDDPAFREDALRGVGNTARRIDEMIARLSALRQQPDFTPEPADLNQLVAETLDRIDGMPHVALTRALHPLPSVLADREQLRSVVANLVLNARDAVGEGGRIEVRTDDRGDRVVLSVADNGCGMSPAFVRDALFRPFQSTKKKGLGIGMFQSRMVVARHGGTIQVESEVGRGTTFRVSLPVRHEHQ